MSLKKCFPNRWFLYPKLSNIGSKAQSAYGSRRVRCPSNLGIAVLNTLLLRAAFPSAAVRGSVGPYPIGERPTP